MVHIKHGADQANEGGQKFKVCELRNLIFVDFHVDIFNRTTIISLLFVLIFN